MGTKNNHDGSTNGASDRSRTSDAKRGANKANAKKSTGPRTAEGKARSSRNATKHGAYATQKVAVSNGLFAEDPVEVETFLSDISRSFPARNPALARIASQIAWNLLRQRRLGQFEAEMLSASGRATGDILGLTPEQARELKIVDGGLLVLAWIMKREADKLGDDPRIATHAFDDVEPDIIGRFLCHALSEELRDAAPDLVAAPVPSDSDAWDERIQAILDACFDDYEQVFEWVMSVAVEVEARTKYTDLLRERAAAAAVDDVMEEGGRHPRASRAGSASPRRGLPEDRGGDRHILRPAIRETNPSP